MSYLHVLEQPLWEGGGGGWSYGTDREAKVALDIRCVFVFLWDERTMVRREELHKQGWVL